MVKVDLKERCPTGIPGFDELCRGGFIRNSVNALFGGPGAGKTIFLLNFLYNGYTMFEENGLYISFEPDVLELFKDGETFGWNFKKLDETGKVKFIKISPYTDLTELKDELLSLISQYDAKRVCFDPISFFAAIEPDESKMREVIFDLASTLKRMNVTVLLATEYDQGDNGTVSSAIEPQDTYIKFLVDGLVYLHTSGLGGQFDRALRISKMRRTLHVRGPIPMMISETGIKIAPPNLVKK
jgi:KaiC/GvpD/RAD55 family RecA-like ATPase